MALQNAADCLGHGRLPPKGARPWGSTLLSDNATRMAEHATGSHGRQAIEKLVLPSLCPAQHCALRASLVLLQTLVLGRL